MAYYGAWAVEEAAWREAQAVEAERRRPCGLVRKVTTHGMTEVFEHGQRCTCEQQATQR